MSASIQMGTFGGHEPSTPYVVLDSVAYPLVPGSIVDAAPLNPFSPSNSDGNTVAVVSQRHASEVWDDLTAGAGYRDDEPGSHQYAIGNLDVRVPNAWVPPHKATEHGSGAAASCPWGGSVPTSTWPVGAVCTTDSSGWAFLAFQRGAGSNRQKLRRITAAGVSAAVVTDGFIIQDIVLWRQNWYILCQDLGSNTRVYQSSNTATTMTFAQVGINFPVLMQGLVVFDDKMISYDVTNKAFKQWNSGTLAWDAYVTDFSRRYVGSEEVRQLFVWSDKSGSTDALYCLTSQRLLIYDDQGQQWEDLYVFGDLFSASEARAHVNRRDNSLVVTMPVDLTLGTPLAPESGTFLVFTPGTVDNTPINKGFAYPNNAAYNSLGTVAPVNHPMHTASGIHWFYAWCYAPRGLGAGVQGGVYAYNEFGGWTQIFDPCAVRNNTTASVIGGGYGSGKLLVILDDGSYYVQSEFDANVLPPVGLYDDQAGGSTHDYFVRSGRIFNKQKNVKKLGSHIEVTFKDPLPATGGGAGTVYLKWRYFNENGLSAFQTSSTFNAGAQRQSVNLNDGAGSNGIQYYYMEWELHVYMPTTGATPPVVDSVVLYYTYFQTNRYAYSFNIDLTAETWDEMYPDDVFMGKSRAYLQNALLAMLDQTHYHTFKYSQLFFTEQVDRADMSLSRRESSDDASGVYGLTVRDLEPDTATGTFFAN